MPREMSYDIVREACAYCWGKNFLNILRDFFAEHAYLFKDCTNDSPPSIEEQDLDQYAVYQRYLRLYEDTLSDYINSLDVSIEDFFFQLEDVRSDPNLKDKKLKNFVNYLLASTDYPAFYKVMVRAAKKQYKDGVLIADSKLSQGESKMADSKGGAKSGGYDSDDDGGRYADAKGGSRDDRDDSRGYK